MQITICHINCFAKTVDDCVPPSASVSTNMESLFCSSCSPLFIFVLSHKASPHLLSHSAYLFQSSCGHWRHVSLSLLVHCPHSTAGSCIGIFGNDLLPAIAVLAQMKESYKDEERRLRRALWQLERLTNRLE